MASKPFVLVTSNASTKNQIKLMSTKSSFLLSNNTNRPIPYTGNENTSIFNLSNLIGNNYHHQFLQIKKPSSRNWPIKISSWVALWPPDQNNAAAYSTKLLDLCLGQNTFGANFDFNDNICDWSRLVKLLFEATAKNGNHGTAQGPLHNTVKFVPNDFLDFMRKNYSPEITKNTLTKLNRKIQLQENRMKLDNLIIQDDANQNPPPLSDDNNSRGISTLIIDLVDIDSD